NAQEDLKTFDLNSELRGIAGFLLIAVTVPILQVCQSLVRRRKLEPRPFFVD
ncbi:hypothetical protein BDZ94DRAFT_1254664, partial [Collybia nuda]